MLSDGKAIFLLNYTIAIKDSIILFLKFLFKFVVETKGLPSDEMVWVNCSPYKVKKKVKNFK